MGMSGNDRNNELPIIHQSSTIPHSWPIFGGERGFSLNITACPTGAQFSRQTKTRIQQRKFNDSRSSRRPAHQSITVCSKAHPATIRVVVSDGLKRTITSSFGQIFTPFVRLRADAAYVDIAAGVVWFLASSTPSQ
jgi:hypothetical protein